MEENNFLAGRRNPTPTDAVLAKCYYPMLCELAKQKKGAVRRMRTRIGLLAQL